MTASKFVFSLSTIFMSIPWKAGLCMKTGAAQCHRNIANLPPVNGLRMFTICEYDRNVTCTGTDRRMVLQEGWG